MAKKAAAKKATKKAAKKSEASKSQAKKSASSAETTPAKKVATKKAASKKAAKKTATPKAAAKSTTAKPAAKKATKKAASKKTAAKKSTTKRAAPKKASTAKAPKAAAALSRVAEVPVVTEVPAGGTIKPTAKRPAFLPATNGAALYRRQRNVMPVAPEIIHEEQPADFTPPSLPESYGRTKISVLIRDAEWLFVYWEISSDTIAELGLSDNRHERLLALRLHDVTNVDFNGANANTTTEIPVNDLTSSWYVHVPRTGASYVVELGFFAEGQFVSIATSTTIAMPNATVSDTFEWQLKDDDQEAHLQIMRLSGGDSSSSHLSSADFLRDLQRRLLNEGGMFSGLFSGSIFSGDYSSSALALRDEAKEKDRSFWLVVDAEVIVYGATEPDAKVKFMGRDIRLNPDGTFGVRMALPDGEIEFPVEATSSDEVETLRVRPVVNRTTD